jgi:hypothetical protein
LARASVSTSSGIVHRPASDGCDHGGGLLSWDDEIETFDELIIKRVGHVTPTEQIKFTNRKRQDRRGNFHVVSHHG